MDLTNHPCFNDKVRHAFRRVHLPVAPRCNIQCNYCNRRFHCVNESRPGVTSGILTPEQALVYLGEVLKRKQNIAVVGIAGPGDPFANAEETMKTLGLVRGRHPELLLCVATNGLNLAPHVDPLAELRVSHVTITVNAVDPGVGQKIYSWLRFGKRVIPPSEGARHLLRWPEPSPHGHTQGGRLRGGMYGEWKRLWLADCWAFLSNLTNIDAEEVNHG